MKNSPPRKFPRQRKKRQNVLRSWSRQKQKSQQKTAQKSRVQNPSCNTPFGIHLSRLSVQRRTGKSGKARMIMSAWKAHISWKKLPSRPFARWKPHIVPISSSRTAMQTAQKLAPTAPTSTRCKSRRSSRTRSCKAIHIPAGSKNAPSKRNMPLQRLAARCLHPKLPPKPPNAPQRTRKKRPNGSRNTKKDF